MLLVVDVGNTNTVFGIDQGDGRWAAQWRLSTLAKGIGNDWAPSVAVMAIRHQVDLDQITAVCICSVVPAATAALTEYVRQWLKVEPLVVHSGLRLNISLGMDRPFEVGSDRIANAVAAWEICHSACIVVDLGTATKIEALSENGDFLGGSIATGLGVSLDALTARAAKLFQIELIAPNSAIGRNTVEALQAGIVRGHVHLIAGLIADMRKELKVDAPVLVTGGHASPTVSPFRTLGRYDPDLTLNGIRQIHDLNQQANSRMP
jgi:type III pantothenate kinase